MTEALDLSKNNAAGVIELSQSTSFIALNNDERKFMGRYITLLKSDKPITAKDLGEASKVQGSTFYEGYGKVSEVVATLMTDGIDIETLIISRPHLFFHKPETNESFLFRNTTPEAQTDPKIQLFVVASREWRAIDLAEIQGTHDEGFQPLYDGILKANDLVTQFNTDRSLGQESRDEIKEYQSVKSLESLPEGVPYYHQEQTSGYCQLHAANAFVGASVVSPTELSEFIQLKMGDFLTDHVKGLAQGPEAALAAPKETAPAILPETASVPSKEHAPSPSSEAAPIVADMVKDLSKVEQGADIGTLVDYLTFLDELGELEVDLNLKELSKGRIKFSETGECVFINDSTGESISVTKELLSSKSRIIFGTSAPEHAIAIRKNQNGSWTIIDSNEKNQVVVHDLVKYLDEVYRTQRYLKDSMDKPFSLPFAIL